MTARMTEHVRSVLEARSARHTGDVPELPEVETVRRGLEPVVAGRRVVEAWGHPSGKFCSAPLAAGPTIDDVRRRGKYLLFGLDDGRELIVHLGMTGRLRLRGPGDEGDPYVRAWWRLDDGEVLEVRDVRRFGRLAVVEAGDHTAMPTLAKQGPEPWDPVLDDGGLWRNLRRSRARVKTQLLSQRPIAGVGNIYADEGLWLAGVHPSRRTVTRRQADALLAGLREALELGLANGGTTLRDYRAVGGEAGRNRAALRCYGRAGEPCERCGTPLRRSVVDARSTTSCPACQLR
jgi:formamidopyrimidine-DNA glycosylase